MYEPQQRGGADGFSYYDSSALTDAAAAAVAAATMVEGEGDAESCEAESAAAADVGRAVRVAELLGLRLVGWCLSHDKVRIEEVDAVREKDRGLLRTGGPGG